MKRKMFSLFLCSVILSGAVCGCGRDASSETSGDIIISTTESIETFVATETTEELTTEPQTEVQSEFDFIKAVESTYICGQKLSYPITWGQFGEDFTIVPDGAFSQSDSQKIACSVNYKEQYLGSFIFKGCESVDAITDDTEVVNILIQNEDVESFDIPKISVNGVTLNSNHKALYEALGNSYEIGIDESQINYCDGGLRFHFGFGKFEDTKDNLVSVIIDLEN